MKNAFNILERAENALSNGTKVDQFVSFHKAEIEVEKLIFNKKF